MGLNPRENHHFFFGVKRVQVFNNLKSIWLTFFIFANQHNMMTYLK